MADRTVAVNLIARVTGYKAGIDSAIRSTKQFGGELDGMRKSNAAGMHSITSTATIAGAALLGLVGWAVKVGMAFDKQMSAVSAVTQASAGELEGLRKAALQAGKDTVFSATEAAKAEEELAKAGISTADIMGGALAGSLNLAAAGSLDLAEAADVSAKAMNIWSLSGRDVGHIADVLAASANKSATDVHEMGMALKMGGLAAKTAGLTLEDTVGTLSAFADRALVGSDAGTSLKTMFMMLSNPTEKSSKAMKELGINVYDAAGNFVGVEKLAGILQARLSGLTQQQRQAALATIFGSDATRAATVLYEEGAAGIHGYVAAVNDVGAASRAAEEKTNNLAGDVERLKGAIETLTITSGEGANGGLRMIVQALDHLVSTVSSLPGPVLTAVTVFAGLSGGGLLAAAAFIKVRGVLTDVGAAMRNAGPVTGAFADKMGKAASVAGKAAGALGVLMIASQLLSSALTKDLNPQFDALSKGMGDWATSGKLAGESARIFGKDAEELRHALATVSAQGFDKFLNGLDDTVLGLVGANQTFTEARTRVAAFDTALGDMVRQGHAAEAGTLVQQMADKAHISIERARQSLPGYAAALEVTATSSGKVATATGEAAAAADKLTDAWARMHAPAMSADEALLAAKQAVDAVGEAFKTTGGKIRGNSEAALTNRIAMGKAAQAAAEAADKYFELTGDAAGATRIMNNQRDAAITAAIANGGNAKQVKNMGSELFKLPASKAVKISTPGLSSAIYQVDSLGNKINLLHDRVVRVSVITSSGGRSGGLQGMASGTPAAPPGWSWTGEEGPELTNFRGGEKVIPHGPSMAIAHAYAGGVGNWGGGGSTTGTFNVNLSGATSPLERAFVDIMRSATLTFGGGNVQTAFGQR